MARERIELKTDIEFEKQELADIYVGRGLQPDLARQVAEQLMAKDALGAHARDELGISDMTAARPVQAAIASATAFASGAALPLLIVMLAPLPTLTLTLSAATLLFLALLGVLGARASRSKPWKAIVRVVFWGAVAMAATAGVGALFGAMV